MTLLWTWLSGTFDRSDFSYRYMSYSEQKEMLHNLLELGANPNIGIPNTRLDSDALIMLVRNGLDPNRWIAKTVLRHMTESNTIDILLHMPEYDINTQDADRRTLLMTATFVPEKMRSALLTKILFRRKAYVWVASKYGPAYSEDLRPDIALVFENDPYFQRDLFTHVIYNAMRSTANADVPWGYWDDNLLEVIYEFL